MADYQPDEHDLIRWGEALAATARTGLGFTESLYEKERYEEILALAAEIRAAAADRPEPGPQVEEWLKSVEPGVAGYATPKLSVGAVVGNEKDEILLIQRADSGAWMFPTGWADVGYSPAEVAVKEVWEETNVRCEPVRLIAVIDAIRQRITRKPFYSMVFLCKSLGGDPTPHPLECLDAGFFAEDNLPEGCSPWWADLVFGAIRGEQADVFFEPPRQVPWEKDLVVDEALPKASEATKSKAFEAKASQSEAFEAKASQPAASERA